MKGGKRGGVFMRQCSSRNQLTSLTNLYNIYFDIFLLLLLRLLHLYLKTFGLHLGSPCWGSVRQRTEPFKYSFISNFIKRKTIGTQGKLPFDNFLNSANLTLILN